MNYEEVDQKLSYDKRIVLCWFKINSLLANPGKFQMLLDSSRDKRNITFFEENKRIKSSNEVKLLRITTDDKLAFTKSINNL